MTTKQLQQQRKNAQREKERLKRQARKEREQLRVQKRKAKRAIKAAPKNALKEWSLAVRAGGRCDVCGATENLQAHHLLPKERYQEFKLHVMNGVVLCPTHHKWGQYSAHRNPIWFTLWLSEHQPRKYDWCLKHMGSPVFKEQQ